MPANLVRQFEGTAAAHNALEKVKQYWEKTLAAVQVETPDAAHQYPCQWMANYQTTCLPHLGQKRFLSIRRSIWIQGSVAGCFISYCIRNRPCKRANSSYVHHGNLKKEMCSIGGIHQQDEVYVHAVPMIFYGCLCYWSNMY